jgi:DNA-directed RNA polymerase subunit RPC12/RpoP
MKKLGKKNRCLDVSVQHRVDATQIKESLQGDFRTFDEVTFCHPHIGSEDLRKNSALVAHFMSSALQFEPRVLQVTLLEAQFDRWRVADVAKLNNLSLVADEKLTFAPSLFAHGYETRRH